MNLRQNNVEKLHNATLRILEEIGIEFNNEYILERLRKENIKVVKSRAYFTKEQIEKYLSMAPSEFIIEGRSSDKNIHISRNTHTYTSSYGCAKIREYNGTMREATLIDHLNFLELVQQSKYHGFNGGLLAHPQDINQNISYQVMTFANMYKSDKPIILMPTEAKTFKQMLDIGSIVFKSEEKFKDSPKTLTWINPLSPLSTTTEALDSIILCCEYNQVIAFTAGSLTGATAPITSAGTIAMNNAELLGLIAMVQILKPGHPVIYGLSPMLMDLRTNSASVASPQYTKISTYSGELSKFYNIPFRSSGGQSDANGVTAQAGYETMMNMMNARQTGASIIMQAGGVLDGYGSISFEKFIMDLEVISHVEHYFEEIEVSEDTLGLDAIKNVVESEGNFLGELHTAKYCRKAPFRYELGIRGKTDLDDTPDNLFKTSIDTRMKKMYNEYTIPHMEDEVKNNLINYMLEIGVDIETLNKIIK